MRQRIEKGDLVIVYEDFKNQHAVRVKPPEIFHSRFGSLAHATMLGKQYGERVYPAKGNNNSGGGHVYLLAPTAELWTATLPHRTQILYIADIAMICLQLQLQPGSVVLEAGTGSGSLSHALARSVGPTGRLHTFEFNAQRAQLAAAEFAANGLDDRVSSRHGDVCAAEWSYEGLIEAGSVDGAIFDLPQPWDAVRKSAHLLRPGGRLCCFSPCIEQVSRTLDVMREVGYTGIEVIEAIVRTLEVKGAPRQEDSIAQAVAKAAEMRNAAARVGSPGGEAAVTDDAPEAEAAVEGDGGGKRERSVEGEGDGDTAAKRARVEGGAGAGAGAAAGAEEAASASTPAAPAASVPAAARPPDRLRSRPHADMRGHTGFLVFATKHVC